MPDIIKVVVCPRPLVRVRSPADVITQPSLPLSEEKGTLLLISPPSVDRVANGRHPFLFAALKRDPLVEGRREMTTHTWQEEREGDGGLRGGLGLHVPRATRRELISSHDERQGRPRPLL